MLILWPRFSQALPSPIATSLHPVPVSQANLLFWMAFPLVLTFDSYSQLRRLLQRSSINTIHEQPPQPWFSVLYKFLGTRLGSYLEPRGHTHLTTVWKRGLDEVDLMGSIAWFGMTLTVLTLTNSWSGNVPLSVFSLLISLACSSTVGFWLYSARRVKYSYGKNYRLALALNFFTTLVLCFVGLFFRFVFLGTSTSGIVMSLFISPLVASFLLAHLLGLILSKRSEASRFRCIRCANLMSQLSSTALQRLLHTSQQTVQGSGKEQYEGWYCPQCSGSYPTAKTVHLRTFRAGIIPDSVPEKQATPQPLVEKIDELQEFEKEFETIDAFDKVLRAEGSTARKESSTQGERSTSTTSASPVISFPLRQDNKPQPEDGDTPGDLSDEVSLLPTSEAIAARDDWPQSQPSEPAREPDKDKIAQDSASNRLEDLLKPRKIVWRSNYDRLDELLKPRNIIWRRDSDRLDELLKPRNIVWRRDSDPLDE